MEGQGKSYINAGDTVLPSPASDYFLQPCPGQDALPHAEQPTPGPAGALPQSSPSSEPSAQSSLPSHSLSGGRQTEVLLAQGWEGGLQARASQFSSSELSSQSLSPSHTHALLMHRAESLQPNLTFGSQTWVTPSQLFSSLESMQSVSPSQRHRRGIHRPSSRHWNSSEWQPPGGLVAWLVQLACVSSL